MCVMGVGWWPCSRYVYVQREVFCFEGRKRNEKVLIVPDRGRGGILYDSGTHWPKGWLSSVDRFLCRGVLHP